MFKALVDLFQSDNLNENMIMRKKVKSIQMSRSKNFTRYFMRITCTHDQLAAIGEKVDDVELVNVALNSFTKSWKPFVKGIYAQEKLPNWERLYDDFIQEEAQRSLNPTSKEMEKRSFPWITKPRRKRKRVMRVNVRGKPHRYGRRT
jgi:hypothetical protein